MSGASFGIGAVANGTATSFEKAEGNFTIGTAITSASSAPAQLSFSYRQPDGTVAAGTLTVFDNSGTCSAFGVAEAS